MPNHQSTQQGIEVRNQIVALVTQDRADGGDGLSRAQLAAELGISQPTLAKHMRILLADHLVDEERRRRVFPYDGPHVHICRTCGQSFH